MQGANILPRCDPLKRLGFEKQINMDSSRLLQFEMLHGGENFKNEEYRKLSSRIGYSDYTLQNIFVDFPEHLW